jgi:hypothetical protein
MPSDDQKALREIFEEMLTEYEIFVNNSEQLIKDAKAILRKQKRSKK